MAKIALSEGFSIIPEGEHIFKITESKYKEEFGKLELTLVNAKGQKHIERFNFISNNGSQNEGAINAFSFFAHTALDDFTVESIDPQDLVGHFIKCTVEHEKVQSNKDASKTVTFTRLGDKAVAYGYDEAEAPVPAKVETKPATVEKTAPATPKKADFDLDDILG